MTVVEPACRTLSVASSARGASVTFRSATSTPSRLPAKRSSSARPLQNSTVALAAKPLPMAVFSAAIIASTSAWTSSRLMSASMAWLVAVLPWCVSDSVHAGVATWALATMRCTSPVRGAPWARLLGLTTARLRLRAAWLLLP